MSFDDLLNTPAEEDEDDYVICTKSKECDKQFCLHKIKHLKHELGRPEQGDIPYSENWDCTEQPCSLGGLCSDKT